MPYNNDIEINTRLHEHLLYALNTYNRDWFVICLQGSQNYGMADEESDIDSKVLLIPSLNDMVLNKKAISHTSEMPNNKEHVDCKDIRDYFKIFRKSNINFVEILFTDYWIVNHKYSDLWLSLRLRAEDLARINPYAAVCCIQGMAHEKRHALCHEYPSRISQIEKFGYDPKQLAHLIRINYFLKWYIEDKSYRKCIYPEQSFIRQNLLEYKRTGWGLTKEEAEKKADEILENIDYLANNFKATNINKNDEELDNKLNDILYQIIRRSLEDELHG